MKKTFLMLAGLIILAAGCEKKNEPTPEPPAPDEITITPDNAEIPNTGDKVEVLVTSSGEWTLSSDVKYEWVEPSAVEGKDGDKVIFEVAANETLEDREAKFTFTCGDAEAEFSILSQKSEPVVGEIEIFPETLSFEAEGGSEQVMVTSSHAWTLEPKEKYDWVHPDITEGEDGDAVNFTVEANMESDDLTATFIFKTEGDASCELTVISKAYVYTLELGSEAEKTFEKEGGNLTVTALTTIPADYLDVTIPEEAKGWIEYTANNPGDNSVDFFFTIKANTTYENRESFISIGCEDLVEPVFVKVKQKQTDILSIDKKEIVLGLEGGTFEIPVTSNIEYTYELPSGITSNGKTDNIEKFTATAVSSRTEYNIVFKPVSSSVPSVTVKVTLKTSALIDYVANMRKNWAWPVWKDATPLNNLSQFTIEMLINIQEWKTGTSISSLIGIENNFLLRMGDGSGLAHNNFQVVYNGGSKTSQYWSLSTLPGNFGHFQKWIAVALTFDKGSVSLYMGQPGKSYNNCGTVTIPTTSVSFGTAHIKEGEENKYPNIGKYCFWIGRSYDNSRDFQGWMSEVRIWNKVLTTSDMNSENHRYYVDPESEGLVAYWKFNEGDSASGTVKDWSKYGNDLSTHAPMDYVSVSLP